LCENVRFVARDLDVLTDCYRDVIGLEVISTTDGSARLGTGDTTLHVCGFASLPSGAVR
jgi:catechol-2,3-dioxygenase